jgi:hypothetical protein
MHGEWKIKMPFEIWLCLHDQVKYKKKNQTYFVKFLYTFIAVYHVPFYILLLHKVTSFTSSYKLVGRRPIIHLIRLMRITWEQFTAVDLRQYIS